MRGRLDPAPYGQFFLGVYLLPVKIEEINPSLLWISCHITMYRWMAAKKIKYHMIR
jgi:hypothetical protein